MSKYGNKKTEYKGELYDSKKEADYAKTLDTLRRAKSPASKVIGYDRQQAYKIVLNGQHICSYRADFVVQYHDGHEEVVDVKGFKTDVYKIKKKLVEALYQIKIIEV